jgi:hypothetical protein
LATQGSSATALTKTHGEVISASEGESLYAAHNLKTFPAPFGGSLSLRCPNRKVVYRNDLKGKQ